MPTPSISVTYWAVPYGTSTVIAVGNVLITTSDETGWVLATSANRGGRRSEGIAVTSFGGSGIGTVEIWEAGTMPSAYTPSLGAGSASWVRVNDTTGLPERFTPSASGTSDIIGRVSTIGRLTLMFGQFTEDMALASGGGGATPGGSNGDVQYRVNSTTFGGLTPTTTGAVLRALSSSSSAFGSINLALAAAVGTSILGLANGGLGQDFSSLTGKALQVFRVNAGETAIELAAVASGGANPAGSGSEIQYRLNGTTFGAVSGASSNGAKIDFSTDPTWTKAAQVGTFAWTPTATRTATMFDATDTVVGKATTDTLTNKTYSLSGTGNVLTDASIAQYDLIMANATPVFRRFAKSGTANRALVTDNGGAVTWSQITNQMIQAGTNGQFLITASSAATWGNTATFVALGTTPATTGGDVRTPNVGSGRFRDAANTGDKYLWSTSSSNELFLGCDTSFTNGTSVSSLYANAVSSMFLEINGSAVQTMNSSTTFHLNSSEQFAGAVGGYSVNSMFKWDTATIANAGGTTTLTPAQYSKPYIKCTGTSGTLEFPAQIGGYCTIRNEGSSNCLPKVSGQTGGNVATNTTQQFINNGTDMRPIAPSVAN